MASRHVIVTALLLLAVASSSRAAVDLSLSFGARNERNSSGSPLAVGLAADLGSRSWPVLPEVGVQIGFLDEAELSLGLVHYWDFSAYRLHLGGGVASLSGNSTDSTKGGYLHGGIAWSRGGSLSLGIDLRILRVDDSFVKGVSNPSSYEQLAFLMRWRWWRDR